MELKSKFEILSPTEGSRIWEVSADLHKLSSLNCSIQCQRLRNRWLKEGDANSKYFYGCINKRRKENEIQTTEVEGRLTKEVQGIKKAIHEHIKTIFEGEGAVSVLITWILKNWRKWIQCA